MYMMLNSLATPGGFYRSIIEADIIFDGQKYFQKEDIEVKVFGYSLRSCVGTFTETPVSFLKSSSRLLFLN